MDESASIARIPHVATLLADPARAAMLWALIDGTTRPAGELAFAANVSAQSASNHLARLVEGGLLLSESHGRHRYFRIASPDAASLIEAIAAFSAGQHVSPRQPPGPLWHAVCPASSCMPEPVMTIWPVRSLCKCWRPCWTITGWHVRRMAKAFS